MRGEQALFRLPNQNHAEIAPGNFCGITAASAGLLRGIGTTLQEQGWVTMTELVRINRRAVAKRVFEALCARYPEKYVALIQPSDPARTPLPDVKS